MKFVPSIRLHTLACLLITAAWWPAQAQSLQYIGQQIVPSGTQFQGTTVGGLSGIDFVASSGRYVAISDDRSSFNPARYYELTLDLAQFVRSANPGQAGVGFQSVTTILDSNGQPFASNTLDPEGIRYNAAAGTLVWSNEGQRAAAGLQNPTVREMTLAGGALRDFAVPTTFNPVGSVAGTAPGDGGIRNNLAFESLTFSTDGRMLYTATENALVQDGAAAALGVGSPSRIVSFDTTTGAAGAQWVYTVEPVVLPPNPAGGFATNGLVELLALGDRQFIAVERSFAVGAATPGVGPNGLPTGNTIRLYFVDASNATDVSGLPSLAGASYTPAAKTLLLDLSTLTHDDGTPLALDNIEGITWGPEYNGKPTLVLVSDNNFGATQFTQFVALSVTSPIPEPGSWALLASGLGVLLMRLRRR
jgi:hypothetical protein